MTDKQITHSCDAKDCEQYYPEHICCHCRNAEWYGLKEQLRSKEQECKDLREDIKDIARLLDLDTGEEYNFGNIESAIKNYCYDCDVAERMRKVTYAATGGRLSYANYTVEAIEQAYNDQLRIDVEYRTKELEEELDQLKAENERLKQFENDANDILKKQLDLFDKKEQTLTEIKEIAENVIKNVSDRCIETTPMYGVHKQILQKISEVENG